MANKTNSSSMLWLFSDDHSATVRLLCPPAAICMLENMGLGRIYLTSCRDNYCRRCEMQSVTNSTLTSILCFFQWDQSVGHLQNMHVHRNLGENKKTPRLELVSEEDIFERSSLTFPLTCGSILWDRSSPQAAIWKSREEWRYAGRGTSGLFWVCADRK